MRDTAGEKDLINVKTVSKITVVIYRKENIDIQIL